MRRVIVACGLLCLLSLSRPVAAQEEIGDDEVVAADSPESWAMSYMAATTFMTSFGPTPALDSGRWSLAAEIGAIPSLSERQRQVGFGGAKTEDLNKSPAFGRLRLDLGLPHQFVLELAYTPPLTVNGARPHCLANLALGRRWLAAKSFSLSSRVFAQRGYIQGDITCPRELAGVTDTELNPYGCEAPSRDRLETRHWGLDTTAAWQHDAWTGYASVGWVRAPLSVQVDALTYSFRDRDHLSVDRRLHYLTLGFTHPLDPHWQWGMEALYVPLHVRRDGDASTDALTSLRLQVRYQPGGQ